MWSVECIDLDIFFGLSPFPGGNRPGKGGGGGGGGGAPCSFWHSLGEALLTVHPASLGMQLESMVHDKSIILTCCDFVPLGMGDPAR